MVSDARARARMPASGARPWYADAGLLPLVGAAGGALAAVARIGGDALAGRFVGSVLAVGTLAALTGGGHAASLASCAQRLAGRRGAAAGSDRGAPGAFAGLVPFAWAVLLLLALEPLGRRDGLLALIAAGGVSRLTALLTPIMRDPAEPSGAGRAPVVSGGGIVVGAAMGLLAALAAGPARGLLALGVGLAVDLLASSVAARRLGGRGPATIGATVALTEVAVCLVLLASWR